MEQNHGSVRELAIHHFLPFSCFFQKTKILFRGLTLSRSLSLEGGKLDLDEKKVAFRGYECCCFFVLGRTDERRT